MSVREELEKLTRLQELDLKIDRARKASKNAPTVLSDLEKSVNKEKDNLNAATSMLATLEKQKRDLETENSMDRDRITNIDSRLGSVTNNKEFHAISKEADKAKKNISDREKAILDLVAKITTQQTLVKDLEVKLGELSAQLDSKKGEITSIVGEAEKEAASYAGDRTAIVSSIAGPTMIRYNRLRTVYSDAISIVNSGRCASCNMALPPQLYIQVQKGLELLSCPSCSRLLFYKLQ